jgi:hypothetical protein
MTKGIYIPMDNEQPLEVRDFSDLKEALGGEVERFALNRPDASLFHSESAAYLDLPTNRRATLALWCHATFRRGKQVAIGDAVLLGPFSDLGELQDVPQWYVTVLLETEHFKVHAQFVEDMAWREHDHVFDGWQQAYTTILKHAERNALVNHVRVVPAQ